MKNVSKIKLNLLAEKLYFEGLSNQLYERIDTFGEDIGDVKFLIESNSNKNSIKNSIEEIVTELKLAPKFIFTFGTGIGAFHGPVSRLLSGSGFNFTEKEIVLLIITSIAILLNDSDAKKLKDKVNEEGLTNALISVKDFISSSQKIINTISRNVTGTGYSLSDILGFTFLLVPTMKFIDDLISKEGIGMNNVDYLFKGLLLSTVAYGVKTVLRRINKRFKS